MKYYEVRPEGDKVVIMLSGYMFGAWSLMPLARCFTDQRVYCIDSIADGENHDETFDEFNESLSGFLNDRDIDKVTLIGYSMGGFAAQYFASKYPEYIDTLILLGSCHPRDHQDFCYKSSSEFGDYLFTLSPDDIYRITTWNLLSVPARNDMGLMAALRDDFLRAPPDKACCMNQLRAMAQLIEHQSQFSTDVDCLSLYARQDLVIKPESTLKSHGNKQIELQSVEGGHLFVYEKPVEVYDIINTWLTRRGASLACSHPNLSLGG
ncbi:alpha/beta fold hydrolase [Serratia rhizosphaerae]|uniref:alpha/beta fold hydrolase n=1 Tax=Serratia sp. Tan611 TaxID=2773264 RepID=UPI001932B269|nr:alpha/beta hydrolase [Serratia sp. Tan611]CAE1147788.1 protein of unknown function [Serratia sp. Tan611]